MCIVHLSFIIISYWLRAQALELGSGITSGSIASTGSRDQQVHEPEANKPSVKLHSGLEESGELNT